MTAYAFAHVHSVTPCEDIVVYLERIGATLEPFGGAFLVHGGGSIDVVEGEWGQDVILIAFPDRAAARGWYDSAAYREIAPLRTAHMRADVVLFDGVPDGYDVNATAQVLRTAVAGMTGGTIIG